MGKGTNTTTNNTTSSADPQAAAAYRDILSRAQGVANTPYQAYTGELTAPVNAQQTAGISGINANANFASPYIQQAAGLASGAANPLSADQIQQYQNPYTQNVVNATQRQFDQTNAQQQAALKGNTISSGALGGNREGVAQANLSTQQAAQQNPIIAGLYSNSYNQGLATANQQFQQNPLAASGAIANYGISGQGAALSGAGAQLGAGTLQQQTDQQRLNALYGQYAQAQAFPYQQTQWLAGLGTGVGSNLGGTSTGQTTAPAPNQFAQYAGAGIAAAGLFLNRGGAVHGYANGGGVVPQHMAEGGVSGTPWSNGVGWIPQMQIHGGSGAPHASAPSAPSQGQAFDPMKFAQGIAGISGGSGGNRVGQFFNPEAYGNTFGGGQGVYGGSSSSPLAGLSAADYGEGYARGGGIAGYAGGGAPDDPGFVENIARSMHGGRDRGQRAFYNATRNGIYTSETAPADGGHPDAMFQDLNTRRDMQRFEAQKIGDHFRGHYAGGGAPEMGVLPENEWNGIDAQMGRDMLRRGAGTVAPQSIPGGEGVINPNEPIRMPDQAAIDAWRAGTPLPSQGLAPVAVKAEDDDELPAAATPTQGVPQGVAGPSYKAPYPITLEDYAPTAPDKSSGFGLGVLSPNAKSGLLAAGLGMLASRSPNLGNAIGEGGLAGLSAYGSAEERDRKVADEARKLSLEAKKAANSEAHTTFTTNESARHNQATEKQAAANADKTKFIPAGSTITADGSYHPLVLDTGSGKVVDAVTGKAPNASDKVQPKDQKGGPISDEDAKAIAEYYVKTGDNSRLNGLGITSAARQAVQKQIREAMEKDKVTPEEMGTRVAEFAGRKAGQRTLGTMEAKMGAAANEAEGAIKLTRGIIEKLPRTSFLPLNQLIQGYSNKTLNPDQAELYARAQAIVNTYSAVMARGANITTDASRHKAEALLNTATNPEVFNRVLDTLLNEIDMAKHSPAKMREFYRQQYGAKAVAPDGAEPTAGGFTPPAGALPGKPDKNGKVWYYDPKTIKGGDPLTAQPYPGQ